MTYTVLTDAELLPPAFDPFLADIDLQLWQGAATDPALLAAVEGFITYGHPPFGGAMMDTMPKLRVISNFGVGVDHIVIADAKARGIPVGNTPGLVDGATADFAFLLLMVIARRFHEGALYAASDAFTAYDGNLFHGQEVYGSTLGIIGMGNIGTEVAKRAHHGFAMPILYHNRNRNRAAENEVKATWMAMDELLAAADFVLLSMPLNAETENMISFDELRQMRSSAYLINIARGGVLDHDALYQALSENWIAGAAVDVTEPEPLPRDHRLLSLSNLLITPHLGSAGLQTRQRMAQRTMENLIAGLKGKPLLDEV